MEESARQRERKIESERGGEFSGRGSRMRRKEGWERGVWCKVRSAVGSFPAWVGVGCNENGYGEQQCKKKGCYRDEPGRYIWVLDSSVPEMKRALANL